MALLAWRLGSLESNQQDDCLPASSSLNNQVWRRGQPPEFTCPRLLGEGIHSFRPWKYLIGHRGLLLPISQMRVLPPTLVESGWQNIFSKGSLED